MSKALKSPTARLLRNSRLFSMPPPLPQPQVEALTSAGVLRNSDTATLPYPTRQAIATPKSSRSRGDWGLKRPLPQKTTNTSTPHLRIKAVDNEVHITDFESAADHTQNLRKWQEMNIVMVPNGGRSGRAGRQSISGAEPPQSAFDERLDNTVDPSLVPEPILELETILESKADVESETAPSVVAEIPLSLSPRVAAALKRYNAPDNPTTTRWKNDGPWVVGMSEQEFQGYLRQLGKSGTKREFVLFLKEVLRQQKISDAQQHIRNERGYDPEASEDAETVEGAGEVSEVPVSSEYAGMIKEARNVSEEEVKAYVKELRDLHTDLSSDLSSRIQEFFDLPRLVPRQTGNKIVDNSGILKSIVGPPVTHPSGGLSYIRTKAYMENHPEYGLQEKHAPVQARVVRPKSLGGTMTAYPKFGIGGFVANDHSTAQQSFKKGGPINPAVNLSLDVEGGGKLWVHPTTAFMDPQGRVNLQFDMGNKTAIEVKTGNIDPNRPGETANDSDAIRGMAVPNSAPRGTANNANYGAALPDFRNQKVEREAKEQRAQVIEGRQSSAGAAARLLDMIGR